METNLVSICITTYNRKQVLIRSLKSTINQSYRNIEIIVVDDCSIDGTRELVSQFLKIDKRIKYIRHKNNKGLAASRNTGILNAKGKYFTFCDDDDFLLPNFVKEFVKEASKYGKDWCFCCCEYNKNFLNKNIKINFKYEGSLKNFVKAGYTPPVASQFYNLSSLKTVNGYNKKIKTGVDHDLWIRLAKKGLKIKYVPKMLSVQNRIISQNRITTNYYKRIRGIKDSLFLWKNDLSKMYGKNYYYRFYDAYLYREKMKFVILYLREFDIKMIFKILNDNPLKIYLKLVFEIISKIFDLRRLAFKKKTINIKPSLKI